MQYRTILLNLNDEKRAPELIAVAASLARPGGAHVIGLYVAPSAQLPEEFGGAVAGAVVDEQLRGFEEQAQRIKELFEDRMKNNTFTYEWRFDKSSYDKTVSDSVIDHARAVDLVIVSQGAQNIWIDEVPEHVLMEAGRPVLVIPSKGNFEKLGSEIVVAWKDTKEATRAVFDAIPLLQKARQVKVVTAIEDDEHAADPRRSYGAGLAAALSRHGINVEIDVQAKGQASVGRWLLESVSSGGQDLLVMGVYGHSRFREFFLGGASRDVLRDMTVPVLMAR